MSPRFFMFLSALFHDCAWVGHSLVLNANRPLILAYVWWRFVDNSCHVFSMNIPSPFMVFPGGSLLFCCGCVNMKKAPDKSINTHENESFMFSHAFGVSPLNFPCFLSLKKWVSTKLHPKSMAGSRPNCTLLGNRTKVRVCAVFDCYNIFGRCWKAVLCANVPDDLR